MKIFTAFVFCFFTLHLTAQEKPAISGIGFSLGTVYTFKNEMTPIPKGTDGVGIYSKNQLGYEITLSYTARIGANTSLVATPMVGIYPLDIKYDLKKEYTGRPTDLSNRPNSTTYDGYIGMKVGLNRFFKIKGSLFSAGAGLGVLYFDTWLESWNIFPDLSDVDPDLLVFRRNSFFNWDRSLIVAPELSLKYFKKLNRRYWLYLYATGTYSTGKFVEGTYEVYGENETLTGDFSKKYAHIGFGAGIFFQTMIKRK